LQASELQFYRTIVSAHSAIMRLPAISIFESWPIKKVTTPPHDKTGRQRYKSERRIASRILDPANGIRAAEAAKIADRIYQCNAASGGRACEKAGREGPENGQGRINPALIGGEPIPGLVARERGDGRDPRPAR
jgi:hypothetical protein